ncbi:hypothetical protein ACFS6H_01495 [Terrimonas rubra]|uniref:YokE-like PH domain-containing protein n=1 Tax=Terrimonas rubra TaxID=1035890 RepID=A0ABW6A2P5_9BACT
MKTNLQLIQAFEILFKPYEQEKVNIDSLQQRISIKNEDASWKMLGIVAAFSFCMMLLAAWGRGMQLSWGFVIYAFVPGILIILLVKYWNTQLQTIDLFNQCVIQHNRLLLFFNRKVIRFSDVREVVVEKQYLNGLFTTYAIVLKTKQGMIDRQIFITGKNEAFTQELAQWCREAIFTTA